MNEADASGGEHRASLLKGRPHTRAPARLRNGPRPWAEQPFLYQAFTVMFGAALFTAFIRFCFILYGYDDPELHMENVRALMQGIAKD